MRSADPAASGSTTWVDTGILGFLVLMFGYAALDKFFHYDGFINAINDYAILPVPMGVVLAPLVIAAELAIAIGLLVSPWRAQAAIQGALLMVVFTIALGANALLGSRGVCGCWFSVTMAQGNWHFVLNGLLILFSVLVWHTARSSLRNRGHHVPRPS